MWSSSDGCRSPALTPLGPLPARFYWITTWHRLPQQCTMHHEGTIFDTHSVCDIYRIWTWRKVSSLPRFWLSLPLSWLPIEGLYSRCQHPSSRSSCIATVSSVSIFFFTLLVIFLISFIHQRLAGPVVHIQKKNNKLHLTQSQHIAITVIFLIPRDFPSASSFPGIHLLIKSDFCLLFNCYIRLNLFPWRTFNSASIIPLSCVSTLPVSRQKSNLWDSTKSKCSLHVLPNLNCLSASLLQPALLVRLCRWGLLVLCHARLFLLRLSAPPMRETMSNRLLLQCTRTQIRAQPRVFSRRDLLLLLLHPVQAARRFTSRTRLPCTAWRQLRIKTSTMEVMPRCRATSDDGAQGLEKKAWNANTPTHVFSGMWIFQEKTPRDRKSLNPFFETCVASSISPARQAPSDIRISDHIGKWMVVRFVCRRHSKVKQYATWMKRWKGSTAACS